MPAITLDPREADLGDFADLIPPEPPPDRPELIGGDDNQQAFQRFAGGEVAQVPRALPTEAGVERMAQPDTPNYFDDLIPQEERLPAVAFNPRNELGIFEDLVKPDTESGQVLAETGAGMEGPDWWKDIPGSVSDFKGHKAPFADEIAKGLDFLTSWAVGGGSPFQDLVQKSLREPEPGEPSFMNAGIPMIPPQETTGKKILAGAANVPIGFANFLLSGGGAGIAKTITTLPKAIQVLVGAGFTTEQAVGLIKANGLQEGVTAGLGTLAMGLGTVAHARSKPPTAKPTAPEAAPPVESVISPRPAELKGPTLAEWMAQRQTLVSELESAQLRGDKFEIARVEDALEKHTAAGAEIPSPPLVEEAPPVEPAAPAAAEPIAPIEPAPVEPAKPVEPAPAAPETPPVEPAAAAVEPIPPPGATAHPPQVEGPHIISSAVLHKGEVLTGSKWNTGHEGIGVEHSERFPEFDPIDGKPVPEGQRGFWVQDASGQKRFVPRNELTPEMYGAQHEGPVSDKGVQSQDLKPATPPAVEPPPELVPPEAPAPAPEVPKLEPPKEPPKLEAPKPVEVPVSPTEAKAAAGPDTSAKKLRVQKAYLLEALDKAIGEAPRESKLSPEQQQILQDARSVPAERKYETTESSDARLKDLAAAHEKVKAGVPMIQIEVPGDGTFTVVNTVEGIQTFRDLVKKKFPSTEAKGTSLGGNLRATETKVTTVGKPKGSSDLIKIGHLATSKDPQRFVLTHVYSDGKRMVATDGRRMLLIEGKAGGTEAKPVFYNEAGKIVPPEKAGQYPNWKAIVPDYTKANVVAEINTAEMQKLLTQAMEMTGERTKSVDLWLDKDGKIGVTSQSPDVGEFAGGPADPRTAKYIVSYDPSYLLDGMKAARALGHETVNWSLAKKKPEMSPGLFSAKGMGYILMPMRGAEGRTTAHPLKSLPPPPEPYSATAPIEGPKPAPKPKAARAAKPAAPAPKAIEAPKPVEAVEAPKPVEEPVRPPEEPAAGGGELPPAAMGAASVKEKLASYEQRKFGQRLLKTETLGKEIRDELGNLYYEPISNKLTEAEARKIIEERGSDEAVRMVRDLKEVMEPRVRVMLGEQLIDNLNRSQKEAREAGDTKAADGFSQQAIETAEWLMEYGTTLGQGVQAFASWSKLTAADRVKAVKRIIRRSQEGHKAEFSGEVGEIIKGIKDAETLRLEGGKKTRAETKAGKKAEKDEQTAVDRLHDRIARELSDTPTWKKLAGKKQNEVIAFIRAHLKEKQDKFVERLTEEFEIDKTLAESFDRMGETNRKRIEGIKQARAIERSDAKYAAIADRIAGHLSDTLKWDKTNRSIDPARQLIREHLEKEQPDFVDRLKKLGVPEKTAEIFDRLAKVNRERIKVIDRAKKVEALRRQFTRNKLGKRLKKADWEKLVELNESGLLNDRTFYEAVAERFGLPAYTPELAADITRMNEAIQKAPEGFQRNEATQDFMNSLSNMKGMKSSELPIALWYSNILSGFTTQGKNILDTGWNILTKAGGAAASHPSDIPSIMGGLYQGMIRGGFEAASVLKTGRSPIRDRLRQQGVQERTQFGRKGGVPIETKTKTGRFMKRAFESKVARPLSLWKYPLRAMTAADTVFYNSFKEMKARTIARELGRTEGLRGRELFRRVDEMLNDTPTKRAAAVKQAKAEGLTGLREKRRIEEILEQGRPDELVSNAHEAAQIATYNHKPTGVLGLFADKIASITKNFPPGRIVVPFTEIVANVFNRLLNYTPWGYKRLFAGQWGGPEFSTPHLWRPKSLNPFRKWDPNNRMSEPARQAVIEATLGTVAMATVFTLDSAGVIEMSATGPEDIDSKRQLQNAGWKPYSVKIGDTYWSYQYTPFALGFAVVGHFKDAIKYNKFNEKDALSRLAYSFMKGASIIFDMSFLSGVSDFVETIQGRTASVKGVSRLFSRTVSSVFIPNLVKQLDKLWDPTLYDAAGIQQSLIRETPVARSLALKPMLNVAGEQIKPSQNFLFGTETSDPVWKLIVDKQAFIPVPSKTSKIGKNPITPEQYYRLIKESGPLIKDYIRKNLQKFKAMDAGDVQDAVDKESQKIREKIKSRMKYD